MNRALVLAFVALALLVLAVGGWSVQGVRRLRRRRREYAALAASAA